MVDRKTRHTAESKRRAKLAAGVRAIAEWEREHGALTDQELALGRATARRLLGRRADEGATPSRHRRDPLQATADAALAIGSGDVLAGELPPRALRMVREWADLHEADLRENWARAEQALPLDPIEPLP